MNDGTSIGGCVLIVLVFGGIMFVLAVVGMFRIFEVIIRGG